MTSSNYGSCKSWQVLVWVCLVVSVKPSLHQQTLQAGDSFSRLTANSQEETAYEWVESDSVHDNHIDNVHAQSISDDVFLASTSNMSLILTDLSKCLFDYTFINCIKMLLLNRVNDLIRDINQRNLTDSDLNLLNGYVKFKITNITEDSSHFLPADEKETQQGHLDIDQQLSKKVQQLLHRRTLQVTLVPGFGVEITPTTNQAPDQLVCFTTRTFIEPNFNAKDLLNQMRRAASKDEQAGYKNGNKKKKIKKKNKKKKGFSLMPFMIVPQMIMLGFLPFALANLKMMVMNAFMVNSMALNGAIFMTLRNLVFGPKGGPKVKYVNYGYSKEEKNKSKRPVLTLHSPAAFVPQPAASPHKDSFSYPPLSAEHPDGPYPPAAASINHADYDSVGSLYPSEEDSGYSEDYSESQPTAHRQPTGTIHRIHVRRKDGVRIPVVSIVPKEKGVKGDSTVSKLPKHVDTLLAQFNQMKEFKSRTLPPRRQSAATARPAWVQPHHISTTPLQTQAESTELPAYVLNPMDIIKLMPLRNYHHYNTVFLPDTIQNSGTGSTYRSESVYTSTTTTKPVFSSKYNKDLINTHQWQRTKPQANDDKHSYRRES